MRTKPRTPASKAFDIYQIADEKADTFFDAYWDAQPHKRPELEPKLARAIKRRDRAFKRWICEHRKEQQPVPKRFWPF